MASWCSVGRRGEGFWVRACLIVALGGACLAVPDVAAAEQPISEEARVYFANGVELLQSKPPAYQDAYYQFKLAYEKSQSWKVLGNLGLCALKLERDGEALGYYEKYLSEGGNEVDPGERKALVQDMALISGNSALVTLTATEANAELISTRNGSSVPPQAYRFDGNKLELRMRAGTHELTATSPDGRTESTKLVLSPRTNTDYTFDFTKPSAPHSDGGSKTSGGAASRQPTTTGGGVRVAGYVATGVGVVALATGVITGVLAQNKEEDAKGECDRQTRLCPSDEARQRYQSGIASAEAMAGNANLLLIGGAVLTVGGVVMIVFGGPTEVAPYDANTGVGLALVPSLGPSGAGLTALGRF
jgi:hypothetical protein